MIKTWMVYAWSRKVGQDHSSRTLASDELVVKAANKREAISMFHERTNGRYRHDKVRISIRVL